jgi:hypothetical protein
MVLRSYNFASVVQIRLFKAFEAETEEITLPRRPASVVIANLMGLKEGER